MTLEREFSKQLAGDLRKETADKLREARNQPETFKDLKDIKEPYPEYNTGNFSVPEALEQLKSDIIGRIFKTENFRKKELFLSEVLRSKKQSDINKIEREYNNKFNKILGNCPLSLEEREKYLSTEALENMNINDYVTLLKRLSGEAFYHVTRYGVRENTFISTGGGHTSGENEFVNSFIPLLENRKINSCVSTIISDTERANSTINKEFLEKEKKAGKSVDEIVDKVLANFGTPYPLDRESSHFSYGKDLHHMYGGEDNYKFYFYYPVEYILQNDFYHSSREGQITIGKGYYYNKGGINQQYNDFEIFNFGEGVPINAGILCITGDIPVDPETGSQYLLKDGKPEIDDNGELKKPEKTIPSKEYWENYFKLNPDLKPNKLLYSEFYTHTSEERPDLKDWAKSKKITSQNEAKQREFRDYQKSTREDLRTVLKEVVAKELEQK